MQRNAVFTAQFNEAWLWAPDQVSFGMVEKFGRQSMGLQQAQRNYAQRNSDSFFMVGIV